MLGCKALQDRRTALFRGHAAGHRLQPFVFPTPTSASFHHHLSPIPSSTSPDSHHTVVCGHVLLLFFVNPFTIFTHPPNPPPLTAVSLFSVSMSLFLFCLLVYFVHQIPHTSKIIDMCLSLSGLFHLAQYSPGLFILLQKVRFSSFLQLISIYKDLLDDIVVLWNCAPETYIILLTNVTQINSIIRKKQLIAIDSSMVITGGREGYGKVEKVKER